MSLSKRIIFAMVAVTVVATVLGGLMAHYFLDSALRPILLDQMAIRSRQLVNPLNASIRAAEDDVRAIANSDSLRGLVGEMLTGGVDSERGIALGPWRERIEANFVSQLEAKPPYNQFRVIGMAQSGREIVRVDRSGEGGSVRVVPQEELQSKGDRDYYRDSIALGRDEVYLSPVELNREFGAIQTPHVPVLRVATPFFGDDGTTIGIVIVNLELEAAFKRTASLAGESNTTYVINPHGDYLIHPDNSKTFGFEFGQPYRLQDDFADLPDLSLLNASEARVVTDDQGKKYALATAPVPPIGLGLPIIVQTIPIPALMKPLRAIDSASLIAAGAAALIALALGLLVSLSFTRPIRQVSEQLESFGNIGVLPPLDKGPRELVQLSQGLHQMSVDIRERTARLEDEIVLRRRTQEDLNSYIEKMSIFTAVVESSDDAIISKDLNSTITSWNGAAERLYGFSAADAIGQSIEIIVPPEYMTEETRLICRIRTGERIPPFHTIRKHNDGHLLDVSLSVSPILRRSGEIVGASSIARDITQQLQVEEQLRLVVESSPNGILMVDRHGIVKLVNRETENLFGYTREELLGKSMEHLVPDRFREAHPKLRQQFAHNPTGRPMGAGRDLYGQRKDGTEFPIEVGLNPIDTREGMMVLGIIVDITERKHAENMLRRYTENLKRSNEDLESFAYAASHDLQEPLRMVASYVELIEKRYKGKLDEKADKYILYAVDGARRMKELINDLLNYSRLSTQVRPPQETDLNTVVKQVTHSLKLLLADAGATLTCDDLPTVLADPSQLGQVFQNLVGNAVKFRGEAAPKVEIRASRDGDFWRLSVQDNGIGIDPKYAERIFQMFQRLNTRETYGGTGIGLAVAKKIVERHGGRIWYQPAPKGGATFFFTIPAIK